MIVLNNNTTTRVIRPLHLPATNTGCTHENRHRRSGKTQRWPGTLHAGGMPAIAHLDRASSASVFRPNFFINQAGGQNPVKEL